MYAEYLSRLFSSQTSTQSDVIANFFWRKQDPFDGLWWPVIVAESTSHGVLKKNSRKRLRNNTP